VISSLEIWDLALARARTVLQTDTHIEAPNWSPDGSYLLVNGGGRLFRVPLTAPSLQPVDTGAAVQCNNDHGISPDGQTYILSSHHEGAGSQIYTIPAKGGDLRRISAHAPSWWHGISPDGKTLTFVAARGDGPIDVYSQTLDGAEQRLTQGEGHCDGPDYSPDGARIYYNCDRTGHAQVWVMNADGTDQRQLFADDYVNWFPHPSPDGAHILYLAYPAGTRGHPANLPVALCLCGPSGENPRRLIEFNGGQGSINVPCWSPDSSAFAFVRYIP
jgi:Tol biopolymer transport system component